MKKKLRIYARCISSKSSVPACGPCEDDLPESERSTNAKYLREVRGCDAPTKATIMALPNECCEGKGCHRCPKDGNGGIVKFTIIHRCPWTIVNDRQIGEFSRAYAYTRRGEMGGTCIFPDAGGLYDQSNSYIQAVGIVDRELNILNSKE